MASGRVPLSDRVSRLAAVLTEVRDEARTAFGALTVAQLNWTPDPKRWSIAQCFDHLITTHAKYVPIFSRLADGDATMSWWERYSPFSRVFGRLFISALDPANRTRRRTTSNARPASTTIGPEILDRFAAHQDELIACVRRLPPALSPDLVITSPLLGIVTYRLEDALVFVGLHCRRHLEQARRVLAHPDFRHADSRRY
jgi:hypothetical protein